MCVIALCWFLPSSSHNNIVRVLSLPITIWPLSFTSDVIEVNVRTCPCASELFCVEGCMFEKKHFLFAIISCYQTLSLDQERREGRGGMPP